MILANAVFDQQSGYNLNFRVSGIPKATFFLVFFPGALREWFWEALGVCFLRFGADVDSQLGPLGGVDEVTFLTFFEFWTVLGTLGVKIVPRASL